MLGRQILGYTPSLIVPGLMAFGAVYLYTRLLEPYQYGYYALALNSMTVLMAACFYWLEAPVLRLMPQAERENRTDEFRSTIYIIFFAVAALMLVAGSLFVAIVPLGDLTTVALLILPLALARSLLNINQSINRSFMRIRRYNLAECGQAVLGLAIGLLLVEFFGLRDVGAILGLISGILIALLVNCTSVHGIGIRGFDRHYLDETVRFGLPMVLPYALGLVLSLSDRFLLQYFLGATAVGIYAVGYTVVDRVVTMIFSAVVTPALPLAIRRLEQEGVEAAREQTYSNGAVTLMLVVPASVGLVACTDQVVTLLVGTDFRDGARQIMPWIGLSSVLCGLSSQYFDHAFHLAKRTHLLMVTKAPAAVCSVALNVVLIPRYGYMGAAYSAVAAYGLMMIMTIVLGRRVFRMKFPILPALKIVVASALMVATLKALPFGTDWASFITMVFLGAAVYAAALMATNFLGIQQRTKGAFRMTLDNIRRKRSARARN